MRDDWKSRYRYLKRYQRLPLSCKIRYANRLIAEGLTTYQRPIVAWSGGKDSTVMLHLILQHHPSIDVAWCNTGVEYPESVKFVRRYAREWNLNLHIAKPRPDRTFWHCVEMYGWPIMSKIQAGHIGAMNRNPDRPAPSSYSSDEIAMHHAGVNASSMCCYYLKEHPVIVLYRQLAIDAVFVGLMATEGSTRRMNWLQHGDHYIHKKQKTARIHPLSIWTENDIWTYHDNHDLPYNQLYDMGHDRSACWPCAMGLRHTQNNLANLRRSHPKLWQHLMDRGLAQEIVKAKLALTGQSADDPSLAQTLLQSRPCFFDKL